MPKIRDLGINVIPVTMRPLEIGPGGYVLNGACRGETCSPGTSGQCVPSCKGPSGNCAATPKKLDAVGFTDDAIGQLRQQLRDRMNP